MESPIALVLPECFKRANCPDTAFRRTLILIKYYLNSEATATEVSVADMPDMIRVVCPTARVIGKVGPPQGSRPLL